MSLVTEHPIRPLTKFNDAGHTELISMLGGMSAEVDKAHTSDTMNNTQEDVFGQVEMRIKCTIAYITREHGKLKSSRKDCCI